MLSVYKDIKLFLYNIDLFCFVFHGGDKSTGVVNDSTTHVILQAMKKKDIPNGYIRMHLLSPRHYFARM